MPLVLGLTRRAEDDIVDAQSHYEALHDKLAERLLDELEAWFGRLVDQP